MSVPEPRDVPGSDGPSETSNGHGSHGAGESLTSVLLPEQPGTVVGIPGDGAAVVGVPDASTAGPLVPGDTSVLPAVPAAPALPVQQAGSSSGASGAAALPGEDVPELVGCPGCGRSSWIHTRRRSSEDFCPDCDYPLFWARGRVVRADGDSDGASVRRLPGTAGRTTVATRPCPSCSELNPLGNVTCLRCGSLMDPVVEVAAPEPEPVPVPVAVAEPEPSPGFPWWWALGIAAACALILWVLFLISA
ncbi:MAG: hypothetical protein ACTHQ3_16360 [Motilibacteraceae bacterium]